MSAPREAQLDRRRFLAGAAALAIGGDAILDPGARPASDRAREEAVPGAKAAAGV